MSTSTVPTTLLEGLNAVLSSARIATVSSLSAADTNEDVFSALQALTDASRQFQAEGWAFNREPEYPIAPDTNGYLVLPNNFLKVNTARYTTGNRLTARGTRLYDAKERTFVFTDSIKVDLVVALEFEQLTQACRAYVIAKAARLWALPRLPHGATFRYTEDYVNEARLQVEREDTDSSDSDLTYTSPHFAKHARR